MELILWRHAQAEDATAAGDLARVLTPRGRKQAQRMGEWLRARVSEDWQVLASPAVRAVETARALDVPFEERSTLAPGASCAAILRAAGWPDGERSVVVVGHQPTLGEAAARILGASDGLSVRKAAIWWFSSRGEEALLRCVLDPDLIER